MKSPIQSGKNGQRSTTAEINNMRILIGLGRSSVCPSNDGDYALLRSVQLKISGAAIVGVPPSYHRMPRQERGFPSLKPLSKPFH